MKTQAGAAAEAEPSGNAAWDEPSNFEDGGTPPISPPGLRKSRESHLHVVPFSERAWAAGLFEGEGCFTRSLRGRGMRLAATLSMTDEDVVRRFYAVVGVGSVRPEKPQKSHHKPVWRWTVRGANVEYIYELFDPWLGHRRRARYSELLAERRTYEHSWLSNAENGRIGAMVSAQLRKGVLF